MLTCVKLLQHIMMLYRSNVIRVFTSFRFDASEISNVFKIASSINNYMSKSIVSFENEKFEINVLFLRYDNQFFAEKWYFMIDCFENLEENMSKWMIKQEVRKFVFLDRSDFQKFTTRKFVEDLEQAKASIKVMQDDIVEYEHVRTCVNVIDDEQIDDVVQTTMNLNEAFWITMFNKSWHTNIDFKIIETWNLHEIIKKKNSTLDFFLMTSSIFESVETMTEFNYCATNYFLDVFARHRRVQNFSIINVNLDMISEMSYLHENPKIEILLLRKDIQIINEDELLQIFDCAIAHFDRTSLISSIDSFAASHILIEFEFHDIKKMRAQNYDVNNFTFDDSRAVLLIFNLDDDSNVAFKINSNLSAEFAAIFEKSEKMIEVCVSLITNRFNNLMLISTTKIKVQKSLIKFEMNSMLIVEFRTWFYQAFKMNVSFLTLLNETTTIQSLNEIVANEIAQWVRRWKK